jgi:hypothetical protein
VLTRLAARSFLDPKPAAPPQVKREAAEQAAFFRASVELGIALEGERISIGANESLPDALQTRSGPYACPRSAAVLGCESGHRPGARAVSCRCEASSKCRQPPLRVSHTRITRRRANLLNSAFQSEPR